MKDTINGIELLESRNKELEEKIYNIGSCDNIVKLRCDNEIRITVEEVFKKNIDTVIKDSHEIIAASLNEVVDKEFQLIQPEKRELMSLFEDFKVRNNKEFDAQKLQMDQIVQEIDALKRSDFDCETNIKTDKDIKVQMKKLELHLKTFSTIILTHMLRFPNRGLLKNLMKLQRRNFRQYSLKKLN